MNTEDFGFERVIVVAQGPNIFTAQMDERSIPYELFDGTKADAVTGNPDLILCVNRDMRRTIEPLKARFPDAQVIACTGGGTKGFSSRFTVVYGEGKHDTRWFQGWNGFFRLIGQPIEYRPPLFEKVKDEDELYQLTENFPVDITIPPDIRDRFFPMLMASHHYLNWLRAWLDDVEVMDFYCRFDFPKKRGSVKRITLPVEDRYDYQGMPVFQEESRVQFFGTSEKPFHATVESVHETEITFVFKRKLTRKQANSLSKFRLMVNRKIIDAYAEYIASMITREHFEPPIGIMSGDALNDRGASSAQLSLTDEQARMLLMDRSQVRALMDIMSPRWVSYLLGPAGTGKTFLTAIGVRQFWARGKVILLTSHSNQGLDNLLAFVSQHIDDDESIYRLGNNEDNVTDAGKRFHRSVRYRQRRDYPFNQDEREPYEQEGDAIIDLASADQPVILGCTMTSLMIDDTLEYLASNEVDIDVVFVDEASRGFLFEALPVVLEAREKLVFVGDPDQLGNIDLSPEAKRYLVREDIEEDDVRRFADGWFNTVLTEEIVPLSLLQINRRSLPIICSLVSQLFYDSRVITGRFVPDNQGWISFLDTIKARDKGQQRKGTSWYNPREANLVIKYIIQRLRDGVPLENIAVITPYRAQIEVIRGKLRKHLFCDNRLEAWRTESGFEGMDLEDFLSSTVNTVDAFQGSQRKEIILSFVRSNDEGDIGFNENINRLRVALSRAEDRLLIIGDSQTFLACPIEQVRNIFHTLISYTKELHTYEEARWR